MTQPVIYPTHHCFDDALEFLDARVRTNPADAVRLFLAHGVAQIPDGQPNSGLVHAHAWVEEGTLIWSAGRWGSPDGELVRFAVEAAAYYAELRITDVTFYTIREARDENRRSGTFGPWLDRYRALCRHPTNLSTWNSPPPGGVTES